MFLADELLKNASLPNGPTTEIPFFYEANNLPGMDKVNEFFQQTDKLGQNIKDMGGNLTDVGSNLKVIVDNIHSFNNYVLHPSLIVRFIWKGVEIASFDICVVVALAGMFMFMCGNKKGSKITVGSMVAYYLIKCLGKI